MDDAAHRLSGHNLQSLSIALCRLLPHCSTVTVRLARYTYDMVLAYLSEKRRPAQ